MTRQCPIAFTRLSRNEFDQISRLLMHHAFASHNNLGRLCDERIYRHDIALRIEAAGLGPVFKEVPIRVQWQDFTKDYLLDLVVQKAFIIELKVLESLVKLSEGQLLNYLFLADVPHGKLINIRPPTVEYLTVNAMVNQEERKRFTLIMNQWHPFGPRCRLMAEVLEDALKCWGAYLDYHLYEEAVIHFFGGPGITIGRVTLAKDGDELGSQSAKFLDDHIAFEFTGLPPSSQPGYESHLKRVLSLTPFKALHWVNLHHREIHLKTLTN